MAKASEFTSFTKDVQGRYLCNDFSEAEAPCCMDRWCGRTEPDPCSGSCDADVLRAPEIQHSVQHVGRDGHLARLSPVRLRTEPLADDTLPARDIGFHESAPVIP